MIQPNIVRDVIKLYNKKTFTYAQIAEICGLKYEQVKAIIYSRRHRSWTGESRGAHWYLEEEAARRGLSKRALIMKLLRRISDDDLCKAILDD